MPESTERHEFRIRITGTHDPQQDIERLRVWLEREPWLHDRKHTWDVRPRGPESDAGTGEKGEGDGPDAPARRGEGGAGETRRDMAVGVDDLVLVITGAAAAEVTKALLITLREWRQRRREETAGNERPDVTLDSGGGLRPIADGDGGSPRRTCGGDGDGGGPRRTGDERPADDPPRRRRDPDGRTDEGGGTGEE
ncbi:hypothetical protein [Streptomyces sp. NPDC003077]|uniref:hypothetical protein n=1 Tax=Streptomyces sp. NPDC003077 TaxID=3154443 RepID=UPI0033AF4780